MDSLKQATLDELQALVHRYPDAPSFLLALAHWSQQDAGCAIIARRFGDPGLTPLSGRDLKALRSKLLDYSQDEVATRLRISRNSVSRIENCSPQELDGKSTYAYLGLVFAHFIISRQLQSQEAA